MATQFHTELQMQIHAKVAKRRELRDRRLRCIHVVNIDFISDFAFLNGQFLVAETFLAVPRNEYH